MRRTGELFAHVQTLYQRREGGRVVLTSRAVGQPVRLEGGGGALPGQRQREEPGLDQAQTGRPGQGPWGRDEQTMSKMSYLSIRLSGSTYMTSSIRVHLSTRRAVNCPTGRPEQHQSSSHVPWDCSTHWCAAWRTWTRQRCWGTGR